MKAQSPKSLRWLPLLAAALAAFYAAVGLFSDAGEDGRLFTTVRGDVVELYGRGIYRFDSLFKAPIFRGTDAVMLLICIPALLIAYEWNRRGALRGRLLLGGVLTFFVYNAASLAFGAMYNDLLLVYIAAFAVSTFALIITFTSIDRAALADLVTDGLPWRTVSVFLFFAALSFVVWIMDMAMALTGSGVPATLGPYTTEPTYVIDVGLLLPAAILGGVLMWRRKPLGLLLAIGLMTLNVGVGPTVAAQSVMQALNGVTLTAGSIGLYVLPFVLLSLVAAALLVSVFRHIAAPAALRLQTKMT